MRTIALSTLLLSFAACGGHDGGSDNAEELITTVRLHFAPQGGGTAVDAAFTDLDGDGGDPPTIDSIGLVAGTTYDVTVRFLNELEAPPEEITDEVRDEGDQHQVFFTGTAVDGPASEHAGAPLTQAYADMDVNGLPIGLTNTFVAAAGAGQLTLTLRHMPPINDNPVKVAGLADQVRAGGFAAIGGENDANVTFEVAIPTP